MQEKETRKNNLIKWTIRVLGLFFIIIGTGLIVVKNVDNSKQQKLELDSINYFLEEEQPSESLGKIEEEIKNKKVINFISVIEIPKIDLKRGLVEKNSYLNNVNYNIQIIKESKMPDEKNSNLILAAHAGTSNVSYFRDINKLDLNDDIYIYYAKSKYIYKIVDKYEINKTGKMSINLYVVKNTITLITCRSGTNKQIIVVAELEKVVES